MAAVSHPQTVFRDREALVVDANATRIFCPSTRRLIAGLCRTLIEHSGSDQARAAAAARLAAYEAARALGVADDQAHVHADAAYRVTATRIGLPVRERFQP